MWGRISDHQKTQLRQHYNLNGHELLGKLKPIIEGLGLARADIICEQKKNLNRHELLGTTLHLVEMACTDYLKMACIDYLRDGFYRLLKKWLVKTT
jgi:hypothetical protein